MELHDTPENEKLLSVSNDLSCSLSLVGAPWHVRLLQKKTNKLRGP
jgi:hypothetical protein